MKSLAWHNRLASGALQDARYAAKALVKHPAFTIMAVATLSLGIGASTVIFSAVNAVLVRPLPFKDADRLVSIHGAFTLLKMENMGVRPREFLDYKDMNRVLDDSAAFTIADLNVTGAGLPEKVRGAFVSDGLFELLGCRAQAGSLFNPDEFTPGRDNVAVISHSLCLERYGSATTALGAEIALDGTDYTIVGVAAPRFEFRRLTRDRSQPVDVWLPLSFTQQDLQSGGWFLSMIGRLKPGVTLEQARADIGLIANGFIDRYPQYKGPHGEDGGWRASVSPIKDEQIGKVRASLLVLLAAVGVLLLIACANVANLVLVRGLGRKREIAIRSALGAGAARIFRQLLIENFIIAILSSGIGLVLAVWAQDLLVAIGAKSIPRIDEISMDFRVLGFCVALAIATPLVFGVVPALRLSSANLADSMKQVGGKAGGAFSRWRGLLVSIEAGLSLVLLIAAGLLIRSFIGLQHVDLGMNPQSVITARLDLPDSKYHDGPRQAEFFQDLLGRLGSTPGVQSQSLYTTAFQDPFSIQGRPFTDSNPSTALHMLVAPRYFETLRIPLLKGRDFTGRDAIGTPGVAIINKALAEGFFAGQDPLGSQIKVGAPGSGPWATIVGVVGDTRDRGPATPPSPTLYMAYGQAPFPSVTLTVRFGGASDQAAPVIRGQVAEIDKDQAVYQVEPLSSRMADSVAEPRLDAILLSAFSVLALALAVVGVYVVLSYSASQRMKEVGIRMALGARAADIIGLMIQGGMGWTFIGIAAGLIGAYFATTLVSDLLFNVSATDPWTFVTVPIILLTTAFLACLRPALKASRLDPVTVLRQE